MKDDELKPCPFCGGEAATNHCVFYDYDVGCFNGECPVEPRTWSENKDEAIAAWNTRAVDPATIREVSEADKIAIREAAIREAVAVAEALAVKWWKEYKDRLSPHCADPHWQGMSDGADDVATAIEALIGEKK